MGTGGVPLWLLAGSPACGEALPRNGRCLGPLASGPQRSCPPRAAYRPGPQLCLFAAGASRVLVSALEVAPTQPRGPEGGRGEGRGGGRGDGAGRGCCPPSDRSASRSASRSAARMERTGLPRTAHPGQHPAGPGPRVWPCSVGAARPRARIAGLGRPPQHPGGKAGKKEPARLGAWLPQPPARGPQGQHPGELQASGPHFAVQGPANSRFCVPLMPATMVSRGALAPCLYSSPGLALLGFCHHWP